MEHLNYKTIHIGNIIQEAVLETKTELSHITQFFQMEEDEIHAMYQSNALDTETLLKWCKLLDYDFFRLYSQHLIFYSPISRKKNSLTPKKPTQLPSFRKNMYTPEIIDFILGTIRTEKKTIPQVIVDYQIPKSTLYKWIQKYSQ